MSLKLILFDFQEDAERQCLAWAAAVGEAACRRGLSMRPGRSFWRGEGARSRAALAGVQRTGALEAEASLSLSAGLNGTFCGQFTELRDGNLVLDKA